MITYLSTKSTIQDSLGHSVSWLDDVTFIKDPSEILDFLLFSCSSTHPTSALRAFWDLDDFVTRLKSILPTLVSDSLTKTNRATWNGYRLFHIPGKMFGVSHSHEDVTFYDLSQYFPDDSCSTIQQVQSKADELLSTLVELGITNPTKLTSPVAIWESVNKLPDIPTIYSVPEMYWDAFEYALQCTPCEWVSAYQVGHWDRGLWEYDLTSAYPFAASQLIDLRDCTFTESSKMIDSAYYGFVHGDLYIDPSHPLAWCSPVVINLDGKLTNAVGHLPTDYYPLDQIRFVKRHQMGSFKLRSGWFISPSPAVRPRQPFKELMSELYSSRSQSPLASYFLKRVMNGIIGRMLQTTKKDGEVVRYSDSYNPIYHALITSPTKIKVAEFIIDNNIQQSELVHVGVDGIKSTKDIPLSSQSTQMGQWIRKSSPPAVILSSGRIYTQTRPKNGATYGLLSALAEVRPNQRRYEVDGTVIDLDAIRIDQTRVFRQFPNSGRRLFDTKHYSEPVVL